MPSRRRAGTAGLVFHVVNRGVRRAMLFRDPGDYQSFLDTLAEAQDRAPMRLLAYCLMPNHFHLVLWPREEGEMSRFMQWTTATHSKRWHSYRGTLGTGPLVQGRFKAFAVQSDRHFLTVCRYVERNALRAGLVTASRHWPWSSFVQRGRNCHRPALHVWPVEMPADWEQRLDASEDPRDLDRLRRCVARETPYGDRTWLRLRTQLGYVQRRRYDFGANHLRGD